MIYPKLNMSRYEYDNYSFQLKVWKQLSISISWKKTGNRSDRQIVSIKMKQNIFGKASVRDTSVISMERKDRENC